MLSLYRSHLLPSPTDTEREKERERRSYLAHFVRSVASGLGKAARIGSRIEILMGHSVGRQAVDAVGGGALSVCRQNIMTLD